MGGWVDGWMLMGCHAVCPVFVEQDSAEGVIEKLATEWKQLDPDNSACLIFICFDVNLLLLI